MVLLSQIVVFLIVVVKRQYLVNGALFVVVLLVVVVVEQKKNVNDHALLFFSSLKHLPIVYRDLENLTYSSNIFIFKISLHSPSKHLTPSQNICKKISKKHDFGMRKDVKMLTNYSSYSYHPRLIIV